jgi:hypothetical protein
MIVGLPSLTFGPERYCGRVHRQQWVTPAGSPYVPLPVEAVAGAGVIASASGLARASIAGVNGVSASAIKTINGLTF